MNLLNIALLKNKLSVFLVVCFFSPCLLWSNTGSVKDSLLVITKRGKDKRYYKSCEGIDVKLLCSYNKNEIVVLVFGESIHKPIVAGYNDYRCSQKTNILHMALTNLSTGRSGFRKLGAILLATD